MFISLLRDFSLDKYNTFGIKAKADYFFEVKTPEDIKNVISRRYGSLPRFILGNGSNVLFTENFKGLILKCAIEGIEVLKQTVDSAYIKVGAGTDFNIFGNLCEKKRYCGLENLAGIPGSAGASAVQNIGAYGVQVGDFISEVEYFDFEDSQIKTIKGEDCKFGYRTSIFKTDLKNRAFITFVTYKLNTSFKPVLTYGDIKEKAAALPYLTPKSLRGLIIETRNMKIPDYNQFGNAGSFFKNPEISEAQLKKLQTLIPDIKIWESTDNKYKISAAKLIEFCGFKGESIGNVGIWQNQPLVLVNTGNATGKEIVAVADKISAEIKRTTGIEIVPEVCIV